MKSISAITAVKNNTKYLFESIESMQGFVSEIIVADIGMEPAIKLKLQSIPLVKIVTFDKPILYIELIREELKQHASNEYILFLDTDEILASELKKVLTKNLQEYDYFSIPRKNIIFNKWIEHSRWWPDYQIRLFKKDAVHWPKIIHSQPQVTGQELKLEPKEELAIIHHNYESADEFMQKLLRYTKVEAKQLLDDGKEFTISQALQKSVSEFIGRYFAAEGYKDGIHGFILSLMQMFYYILVYLYYWEGKKYIQQKTDPAVISIFFKNGLYESNHWLVHNKLVTGLKRLKLKILNNFLKTHD